jgi:ribosomal protein S18 acetylase RimI-like enzyme
MSTVSIRDAVLSDASLIRELAEQTWWPTYSPIVEKEQIRYMLDVIYAESALQSVMKDGSQHFLILSDERGPQGFASFGKRKEDDRVYKLHKIYVLPNNQGKGYGKKLIEEIKTRLAAQGIHTLDLNVNRYNTAKDFYEKLGFMVIKEEDVPIGPYWMNDYVMRLVF